MTELNAFREEIRGWLQDNCPKSIQTPMAADEYPGGGRRAEYKNPDTKLWLERCAEKGYTVPAWPKEYGGGGLSKEEVVVFQQEMREINARPPLVGMGLSMIGPALLDYGTEEQKKSTCQKLLEGISGGVRVIASPVQDPISRVCEPQPWRMGTISSLMGRRFGPLGLTRQTGCSAW